MFFPICKRTVIAGTSAIMMVVLAVGSLTLSACKPRYVSAEAADKADEMQATAAERDFIKGSLTYTQDAQTGLCFAGSNLGDRDGLLTNVPCTPEVLAVIVKENS